MNKNNYKSAFDNIKFSVNLNEMTMNYLIAKSKKTVVPQKTIKFIKTFAVTAAAVFVLIIILPLFTGNDDFILPNSTGNISVKYVNKAPLVMSLHDLVYLTEEEIFNNYNTSVLKGTVEKIRNIEIDFNGFADYRAIAEIKIDKVYRGNETSGDIISVLIPCPIDSSTWIEDTDVISGIRVGTAGIFMPVKYDETSYREENGARVYWLDITEYGFMDGMRFAFIKTENGMIFDRDAFMSVKTANSFDEIEKYIMEMSD